MPCKGFIFRPATLVIFWLGFEALLPALAAAPIAPLVPQISAASAAEPAASPSLQGLAGISSDGSEFSIVAIEPQAEERQVLIRFSRPLVMNNLEEHLRVFPYASLWWHRSKQIGPDTVLLAGSFRSGQRYVLSLPEDFAVDGIPYRRRLDTFIMPDRPPRVGFAEPGTVIERDSRQMLHLETVNCARLQVRTMAVPPLLLPHALAASEHPEQLPWDRLATEIQTEAGKLRDLAVQEPVLQPLLKSLDLNRQVLATQGGKNQIQTVSLPLTFRAHPEQGAIQLIALESLDTTPAAPKVARLVRITDLGLSAKLSASGLLAWTTSLRTGLPRSDVALIAVDELAQAFLIGRTDAQGLLQVRDQSPLPVVAGAGNGNYRLKNQRFRSAEVRFLIAVSADDSSFLALDSKHPVKPDGIAVKPGKWQDRSLVRNTIFTERGIYQPGETVHLKAIQRRYRDGRIFAPDGRVTIHVSNAKDEEIYRKQLPLSAFGSAWDDVLIEGFQPLGTYTATVETDQDPPVKAATSFQVQEFRPPRHFARIAFESGQRTNAAYVNLNRIEPLVRIAVSGRYYAGGPVKNAQVRWKIHYSDVTRSVPGWEDYDFGYAGDEEPELIESGEALLDPQGRMTLDFPLDQDVTAGKRALEVSATVIDFDGRASTGRGTYQSDPDFLVGIGRHSESVQVDTPQRLTLVVLDKERKPLAQGRLEASVLSRSGTYVRTRNDQGHVDWEYREIWRRQYGSEIELKDGRGDYECTFAVGGRYLVAFTYHDAEGHAYRSATRFTVGGDPFWTAYANREREFEPLQLQVDRTAYRPGMNAALTVAAARPIASALLTLEQGDLVSYRVLSPAELVRPIAIPITAQHRPNLYVSVLAISPRGDFPLYAGRYDAEAPGFLFGTLNLPVQQDPEDLTVAIGARGGELAAAPGDDLRLELRVTDGDGAGVRAELAVAAVNEAVLGLTGYQVPNLSELRRFDGPLGVLTHELRALLLKQTPYHDVRVEPLTGGGGAELGLPSTSVRKDFRPVAFYHPAVVTDASGSAEVTFKLPDTMTQYRLFAVAADSGSRFGSAARRLTVSKPFYLEPGVPRFFLTGDRFRLPIQVFNRSAQSGDCTLAFETGPSLQLAPPQQPLPLAADAVGRVWLEGRAAAAGSADLLVAGRFADYQDAVRVTVPVEDPVTRGTEARQGSWRGRLVLDPTAAAAWPELLRRENAQAALRGDLELSTSPLLLITGALHYLLDYPYGCIEQTSSKVLALAGLRGLTQAGAVPDLTVQATDRFLDRGIARILSMQNDSGGFGYWPGYEIPDRWGSIYAAAALALSRENGFTVAEEPLKRVVHYLEARLADPKEALTERLFAGYVLKLFGSIETDGEQGKKTAAERAAALPSATDFAASDLTARTLRWLAEPAGAKPSEAELQALVEQVQVQLNQNDPQNIFNARYLDAAAVLLLAAETAPRSPATARAAEILLDALGEHGHWSSSSDTGWALLALSRYFREQMRTPAAASVRVDRAGTSQTVTLDAAAPVQRIPLDGPSLLDQPRLELTGPGDRDLFYRLNLTFPRLDYAREGHDGGFKVSKKIENLDGVDKVRVGDMVRVTVELISPEGPKRFVMLDDPLPAGLVAINSALASEEPQDDPQGYDAYRGSFWEPDGTFRFQPNFFEIRDRRVTAFRNTLWAGAYRFVYYARAVCEGSFAFPSTKVELMYLPEVNGFSPAGTLTIDAAPETPVGP